MVMWEYPYQYKNSYLFNVTWRSSYGFMSHKTAENQYNINQLVPGSSYNITVITETSDGTQGSPTWISTCTSMIITAA